MRHTWFQSQSHRARLPLLTFPQVAPARQKSQHAGNSNQTSNFQQRSDLLPAYYTIYTCAKGCGWVEGRKKKYRFWKSNDIFPCLSILILHRSVGVRAGWLHMLHPLTAAYKVTFISPARIFSEVFFPARRLFLPEPFILSCVKHILFLVNCLSLSPSTTVACGCRLPPPPSNLPPVQGNVHLSWLMTSIFWRLHKSTSALYVRAAQSVI